MSSEPRKVFAQIAVFGVSGGADPAAGALPRQWTDSQVVGNVRGRGRIDVGAAATGVRRLPDN
ncbi:hypothetical protein ACGFI9_02850 [Micromonospora sp. NPDC048930]|uniref:hypothetical protein n=1 Tax=Micromonospora sp. NPDC048930 TaxID=3364261 RepID=UPI00371A1613